MTTTTPNWNGSRAWKGKPDLEFATCPVCKGRVLSVISACSKCRGTGKVFQDVPELRIEIPVTAAQRLAARQAAIRYANSRKPDGATDYAHRDVRERSEIGFLGQSAFIEHFGLARSDGIKFDALTKTGKRVEIKVKTAWGLRPDYDIQLVERNEHDFVVWLHYDEQTRQLFWVGLSYPNVEKDNKVLLKDIQSPDLKVLQ